MENAVAASAILFAALFAQTSPALGVTRHYYIAAVDYEWDYTPAKRDLVFNHQSEANQRIETKDDRIGSKYTKATYKEYTDITFRHEVLKPDWLGFLGPILRAEVGDLMIVHFRNAITVPRNLSIHPHGVFYTKKHEGALYLDGESGLQKIDDAVPPGGSYRYVWNITQNFAPTKDDDACIPFAYHSHVEAAMDIDSGLLGILLVCKNGALGQNGKRTDVRKEFLFYLDETDENRSHYIEKNLKRCLKSKRCSELHEKKDKDFITSNHMDNINGYSYGNLPGLDVCEGEEIAIYFMSLADGIHTAEIYGQTFVVKKHRMDTVALHPGSFYAAKMVPINPGSWLLVCRNNDHFHDGMTAFFNVHRCSPDPVAETPPGKLRRYYIAAEEVNWNYLPDGKDNFRWGKPERDHGFSSSSHHHLHHDVGNHDGKGNTYRKAVFVEYTDETFSIIKPRPTDEEHLQMIGPPIKIEVGDILEIVFLNKATRPYSIFPHGVGIDKSMEGSVYYTPDSETPYGAIAQPNDLRMYHFTVPWTAAPTSDDPNCLTYMYHSAVDVRKDTNTGLVGPLLVCKPGALNDHGRQVHVNKEFFVLFSVIDENLSWYLDESLREFQPFKMNQDRNDEGFKHGHLMHAINGRVYANLEGLDMCLGDKVSWHFFGLGANRDIHTIALEGNALSVNGRTLDARIVTPGLSFTGYMHPDNPGIWALFCHTNHHLMAGMVATYNVSNNCTGQLSMPISAMPDSGVTRRYYIAAIEIEWDYAKSGIDKITGKTLDDRDAEAYLYTRSDDGYLGTTYKKAVYREFTDDTFTTEKKRGYRDLHLGVMGPFIRAAVGDTIQVVFMNKASRPYSIKPHGVFYNKKNEGMKYNDSTPNADDKEVQPGVTFTYEWQVPTRAGPGPNEPNCIGWIYHSGTNMVRDIPTGLIGPLITCRSGILDLENNRLDNATREFATLFYIFNENRSWYIRDNMRRGLNGRRKTAPQDFEESNLMNSVNGFIYGNTPGLVMENGENVTWYVLGAGSENDYHTVHFHGQTYIHKTAHSHRADVVEVFPGTYETVVMKTDNEGTWLIHCHVTPHLRHGMEAKYAIVPTGALRPLEEAEAYARVRQGLQQRRRLFAPVLRNETQPDHGRTVSTLDLRRPGARGGGMAGRVSVPQARSGIARRMQPPPMNQPMIRTNLPLLHKHLTRSSQPPVDRSVSANMLGNLRHNAMGPTRGVAARMRPQSQQLRNLRRIGILPGLSQLNSATRNRILSPQTGFGGLRK